MSGLGVREILEIDLDHYRRRLEARILDELEAGCRRHDGVARAVAGGAEGQSLALQVLTWLRQKVDADLQRIHRMRLRHADFNVAFSKAVTEDDRRQQVIRYAKQLGASQRQLDGDWKAFTRWFGHDAVTDRFVRRLGSTERRLALVLEQLGAISAFVLRNAANASAAKELWSRLDLENSVRPVLSYDGDSRVVKCAFAALSRALRELPRELQERSVDESTLRFIYRSAVHGRQDVWIQCEALRLLESLSTASLEKVLHKRLSEPAEGDELFVRKKAVEVLGRAADRIPSLARLVPVVARDPSPFVRQGLAGAVVRMRAAIAKRWVPLLARDDEQPQVRASALLEGLWLLTRPESDLRSMYLGVVTEAIETERSAFVAKVAAHVAHEGAEVLRSAGDEWLGAWGERTMVALDGLRARAESLEVRRAAARARERIWLATDGTARGVLEQIAGPWAATGPGESAPLDVGILEEHDEEAVGRVMSVLAQEDFPAEVVRGRKAPRLLRGHRFGFRLWRFLHEVRTPSPDKRQAHPHTIARVFRGDIRVPSAILGELAETKVPGEPLNISEEGDWRPWLPLVDDVLSSLDQGLRARPVRLYTSEGVTEIVPPQDLRQRLVAYLTLTNRFRKYARLRNWRGKDDGSPRAYIEALEALGFRIELRPYADVSPEGEVLDRSIARFFPLALPWTAEELWQSVRKYFVSVYDNSLFDLAVFSLAITGVFVTRHWLANRSMQRARAAIPLVIGGWGTRGKSGTERLKAALINGLGYGFVSKTTGCEAMFLYGNPYGRTREMFLFRPYDKATIWEQRNVVRLTARLEADVFLWECMGLTPGYVQILQRHWMNDDVCTITNTYPDHEDLQGPAGIDIPHVMCNFIPQRGRLYTTEDQMAPILEDACKGLETSYRRVSWIESGLLTPDILGRFPYEEHPNNIALVATMAEGLGIDRDFALKEMADRVVPDIGVLKTHPPALVRSRRLEFTNGMSANERHGCLGNWKRLGFDKHRLDIDPGIWVTTVVNNRADRVARSKVFASILVRDISADRHVLIGNNLTGLQGYIQEAWDEYASVLTLKQERDDGGLEDPLETFVEALRRYRLPASEAEVEAFVRAMLEGVRGGEESPGRGLDAARLAGGWRDRASLRSELVSAGVGELVDEILEVVDERSEQLSDAQALMEAIRRCGAAPDAGLDRKFREFLSKWFLRKIVVVEDYYSTGNQVIQHIVEATPPGLFARIMGLQNIKGTGLDFVYRWHAWDTCHLACQQILSQDSAAIEQGIQSLAAIGKFGILDEETARNTIAAVREQPGFQRENVQAELNVISAKIDAATAKLRSEVSTTVRRSRWLDSVAQHLEQLLDSGDSVRRRKLSNRIYEDLVAERISQERAVLELQKLNSRQKGGWLLKSLQATHGVVAQVRQAIADVRSGMLRALKR